MKYRINKYLTLNGKTQEVSLPDSTYEEWIIYENNEIRLHLSLDYKTPNMVYKLSA